MFKLFKPKKEEFDGVSKKVARHYSMKLQSPYVRIYNGNVEYIVDAEPVISGDMVAVFEDSLVSIIKKLVEYNGYTVVRNDLITSVLEEKGISLPKDRRDGEVVFIEDSEVYSYVPGMKQAKHI